MYSINCTFYHYKVTLLTECSLPHIKSFLIFLLPPCFRFCFPSCLPIFCHLKCPVSFCHLVFVSICSFYMGLIQSEHHFFLLIKQFIPYLMLCYGCVCLSLFTSLLCLLCGRFFFKMFSCLASLFECVNIFLFIKNSLCNSS